MSILKENIESTTIEHFAHLIIEGKATFVSLKEEIRASQLSEDKSRILLKRLSFANERIHKSLALNEILFYTIIPLRIVHALSKHFYFDPHKEKELGFNRKVNQYYAFSILGVFLYLLIIVVCSYYNEYKKLS